MGLLEGKVALVTGGTSGIGRTSAVLFAKEGAKVVLTCRRTAEGESVVAEIKAAGGEAIFVQADLAQIESIPSVIAHVVSHYGRLDCAFNNAGVSGGGPLGTVTETTWDSVIDTNLKATYFCLQAEAEQMKQQGGAPFC
jgi:NAD(P)-dependent dehydrogenase (short-subunit alcohol dehydrogenase family)